MTALLHGDRDPSIAAMVLDSPFADLTRLCEEMVDKARDQGINVPGFVSSVAIRMIRGSVKRQADFDIKDVSPIAHVPHCYIPALFVAAENDDFITKAHSYSLHDSYAGVSAPPCCYLRAHFSACFAKCLTPRLRARPRLARPACRNQT